MRTRGSGAETLVFLLEGDIGFAEEALQRLRDLDPHPAAVLARDVLVLRWPSVRQPVLALDSGATDLREVLPELLASAAPPVWAADDPRRDRVGDLPPRSLPILQGLASLVIRARDSRSKR